MEAYQSNAKLLAQLGYKGDEIFQFDSAKTPEHIRDLFTRLFNFSHVNLTEKWKHFPIEPGIFFFKNDDRVNARATRLKNNSIISINKGLIINLYDFFDNNKKVINETTLKLFPELPENKEVPFYFLLFQLTSLFTYYHEHGHILQFSELQNAMIDEQELMSEGPNFSQESHAREIDADTHGGHLITFHIIEYWKKLPVEFRTKANFENLLSIVASGIFVFFYFLRGKLTQVYLKDYKHPHEVLRISYIVDAVINVAELNAEGFGDLDSKRILHNSFELTDALLKAGINASITEYIAAFEKRRKEMKEYLVEMQEYMKKVPYLVRNQKDPYR